MDAMILAAGRGTRLGELTRNTPKALIELDGATALEHVARRLIAAGADRIIINVHHHADRIMEHVAQRGSFGVEVIFSREQDAPLETGGGLLHAARHFRRDAAFLLHNVDVICDADLAAMYEAHEHSGALVTLAVSERQTSRYLLFDSRGRLCGRLHTTTRELELVAASDTDHLRRSAFAGIHVVSPQLFDRITESGAFSIMDVYLRLAATGEVIGAYDVAPARWLEIGTPERLEEARRALRADADSAAGQPGPAGAG
jgi:N-acetyl-alpha-D-muramate 1-phosphate uridylyltransferase